MKNAHTISHLASFGLAVVLLILTGFSIGAAVITQQLATNAQLAVSLSDRYEHARYAVGAEESLERKYRLEPSPEVYALHRAAATTLVTILLTIQHDGSTQDQILIKHILSVHTLYLAATRDMFAAVDAHDPVRVERIDHLKVDPVFEQIQSQVNTAADTHHTKAVSSLAALNQTQNTIFVATPLVFACGLLLLSVFGVVLRKYQRRQLELAHFERMALIDPLTSLPNHRTMMDHITQELARCQRTQERSAVVFVDLDHFKHINDTWGHRAGDAVLRQAGRRLKENIHEQDVVGRYGGEEFVLVLANTNLSEAKRTAEHLRAAFAGEPCLISSEENPQTQTVIPVTASIGLAIFQEHGTTREALIEAADRAMYYAKQTGRNRICIAGEETALTSQILATLPKGKLTEQVTIQTLTAVADTHDGKTSAHAHRLVTLTEATARRLGRSEEEIHLVRLAALFHDLGKIGIPDSILHKQGPLTEEEWTVMRRHPVLGQHILVQVGGIFELLSHIVVAHHERWDGRGYPHGLAQSAIPLGARILSVVDSYDAMTSQRPYRPPLSDAQARAELQRCAGGQFDPQVVEVFLHVLDGTEQPQAPVVMGEPPRDATPAAGEELLDREAVRG